MSARDCVINGLVAVIVLGTAYGMVADEPDKRVVMTKAEFDRVVREERIQAAQEAFTAAREDGECFMNWRKNPKPVPGTKPRGPM